MRTLDNPFVIVGRPFRERVDVAGPFVAREPTYSTSDFPWRTFVGLEDHEMTVTYPYERLVEIAPYIKPVTDYVGSLKSMFSGQ